MVKSPHVCCMNALALVNVSKQSLLTLAYEVYRSSVTWSAVDNSVGFAAFTLFSSKQILNRSSDLRLCHVREVTTGPQASYLVSQIMP